MSVSDSFDVFDCMKEDYVVFVEKLCLYETLLYTEMYIQ